MRKLVFNLIVLLCPVLVFGQSIESLYRDQKFSEVVKFASRENELSGDQLYMVGYSYFRLQNDEKAIQYYDKAKTKGGTDTTILHFFKGLSLNYLDRYDAAIPELSLAVKGRPGNQEYLNELGLAYLHKKSYDTALAVFEKATKLENTYPAPYYYIGLIYEVKDNDAKAFEAYNTAKKNIPTDDELYVKSVKGIALIEYRAGNYTNSANAYKEAIAADNNNYDLYYGLMRALNAAKIYNSADSVFKLVQAAYRRKALSKEDMEIGTVPYASFKWQGHTVSIRRSLEDPVNDLDIFYKAFVLDKEGKKVERTFLVEKTAPIEKDLVYLLCERDRKTDTHYTYPYGWGNNINTGNLQQAVEKVLDGQVKPAASSNFK